MNNYRRNEIYVSNETRFYLTLRAKELVKGTEAERTIDAQADADLINLYTTEHPEWVIAWERREQLRQEHRKQLTALENEAIQTETSIEKAAV